MLINSSLLKEHGYINGKWVDSQANQTYDQFDPGIVAGESETLKATTKEADK